MRNKAILIFIGVIAMVACSGREEAQVPRPRGFFRIELPDTGKQTVRTPWNMELALSAHAKVSYPADSIHSDSKWLNIDYPALNATVYCTYYSAPRRAKLLDALDNRAERIMLNTRGGGMPETVLFVDTVSDISHRVFFSPRYNVVPFQFLTTDSTSFLFSGAAYFHGNINPDSIAPAMEIIEDDLISMLQNLKFNGNNR